MQYNLNYIRKFFSGKRTTVDLHRLVENVQRTAYNEGYDDAHPLSDARTADHNRLQARAALAELTEAIESLK